MVYPAYLDSLASDYVKASKQKEFPYAINIKQSPLIEFTNPKDLLLAHDSPLDKVSFFMEYSVQDDVFPMTMKESWEFLRRYPTFYAFNGNPKSYTRIDSRDKLRTKYN